MKIVIISARGASKRTPKNNIEFFGGKPMIVWVIGAERELGLFDHQSGVYL